MRTRELNVKYLILTLLFACANEVFAYMVIKDDIYYDYISGGNYVSVVKRFDSGTNTLRPYSGFIDIPQTIEVNGVNVPVKYIATDAFQGCTGLLGVSLPNTITKINSRAFFGCTSLSSIYIPNSVEEIGQAAFYGCTGLTDIYGMEKSKIKIIGANAFCQCSSINSVSFPNTLETIGNSAFENSMLNSADVSITLPQSLKRIGDKAFLGVCINSLFIPKNVISIGARAFDTYGCYYIGVDPMNNVYDSRNDCNAIIDKWNETLVFGCNYTTIPDGITGISSYAFANCMLLTSVEIPESVTSIGASAFFNCINLNSVKILGNVTELQESCFGMCPIRELVLPSSLKKIGVSALSSLRLESLVLPENLHFIADEAISSSTIKNIVFPESLSYIGSKGVVIGASNAAVFQFMGDVPGYVADDAFGYIEKKYNPVAKHILKVDVNYEDNYVGNPWDYFGSKIGVSTGSTHSGGQGEHGGEVEPEVVESVSFVELVDGQAYDATKKRLAETLTYTRNFRNDYWQSLYIPFSMSYDDWKDDFDVSYLNAVRMYDTDDDDEYDVTELELIRVTSGTLIPNHPYFIRAKNVGLHTFTLNDVTLYPAESNSIDCATVGTKFEITGTYAGVDGVELVSNKYYALSKGQLGYTTNVNSSLSPYRWYLKIYDRGSQLFYISVLSRIRVCVRGEEANECEDVLPWDELFDADAVATGICQQPIAESNDDAPIYTLEGVRVNGELHPGIYVKNGKKIIVR